MKIQKSGKFTDGDSPVLKRFALDHLDYGTRNWRSSTQFIIVDLLSIGSKLPSALLNILNGHTFVVTPLSTDDKFPQVDYLWCARSELRNDTHTRRDQQWEPRYPKAAEPRLIANYGREIERQGTRACLGSCAVGFRLARFCVAGALWKPYSWINPRKKFQHFHSCNLVTPCE